MSSLSLACVSMLSGELAKPIDANGKPLALDHLAQRTNKLEISGVQLPALASRHFGMLVVTFDNMTSAWQHITDVRISLSQPEQNGRVIVPSGKALEAWVDATLVDRSFMLRDTANALYLAGLSDWIERVTRDRPRRASPTQREQLAQDLQSIAQLRAAPLAEYAFLPEHLLDAAIDVPPGLGVKRWLVLNTPIDLSACIRGIELDYSLNGARERVWMPFETKGSDWQEDYCFR